MKVEYLRKFSRDLDKIRDKAIKERLITLIEQLEEHENLTELNGVSKLTGFQDAYRIRIGDYRLGFFYDGETIELARFLQRKEIYRLFP